MHSQILFTSKANTLQLLYNTTELLIAPLFVLNFEEWKKSPENILQEFCKFKRNQITKNTVGEFIALDSFAVRSSSIHEDTNQNSGAGAFLSILNVCVDESEKALHELSLAINKVFASYPIEDNNNQVLIQPMIQAVLSGVITTRVLTDGSPYYVINYDDESGKTDTITSGIGNNKTVYVYRNAKSSDFDSKRLYSIVEFARKIEKICNSDSLDIEFCIDSQANIYLLQVRPLCTQSHWIEGADKKVSQNINYLIEFLERRMNSQVGVFGKTTILGCMPDWNPAEMIGITPRPLATSLYRYFITKRVWSKAREMMGYRAMPPEELMILLGGRPYIDVRLSFNSFLPAGLDSITGEALVNAWIDRLNDNPQLHDKIEFEIAQTAMTFAFEEQYNKYYTGLLSKERKEEFKQKLSLLTANCLDLSKPHNKLFSCENSMEWAFDAIAELNNRQTSRGNYLFSIQKTKEKLLPQIVLLAEECKNLGTIAFSIIARHAFIAESLLRSAIQKGALSQERYADLKLSIKTISGIMSEDFQAVQQGHLSQKSFMEKYGHLRPSTYDILSSRYIDRKEIFDGSISHDFHHNLAIFKFTAKEKRNIEKLLGEAQLPTSINNFYEYIVKAISGREYAKFIFTKNISDIIELIAKFGESYGLDREIMSYLDVRDIMEWSSQALLQDPQDYFKDLAKTGKDNFDIGRSLKLGYLIRSSRDIFIVPQHRNAPNFVGNGQIEAPICKLSASSSCAEQLDNCVICIESADPGFDWIFTRNIAGLVTKFGGTNSHMAIRCAEYGLPAAIGVGELLFEKVSQAKKCLLNVDANVIVPM